MATAPQQGPLALFQGFNQLPNAQKVGLMLGLAAVIALFSGLWMWSQTPDYRVLYSNVSDRDGGAIIAALQQMNIPYKMAEGGGAILVPGGQVYSARFRLASQGLPRGGTVGFELLDTQKLGTSEFQQQVNYQRAREGELARSIQSISAVQAARVHLAIPRPSVFVREQQKPSASVLLNLYPGRSLDAGQISGILHMVSSSVPELSVNNVTVIDQAGRLLSSVADGIGQTGLDPGQLDYLHRFEQGYAKRIENILAPITGGDNVRAQVTADLDFSQTEQTAETFNPTPAPAEAAMRSQQTIESTGGSSQAAAGVPGALSNQPPGTASAPLNAAPGRTSTQPAAVGSTSNHKESTVNFEVDKSIKHVKEPVGGVKRLSVGVVVNYRKTTDQAGKVGYKPFSTQEMAQINNLVREAMGYNQARGDTLNVVNAAFSIADKEEAAQELPIWKDAGTIALAKEIGKYLLIAGVAFYLVFGVLRPLFKDLVKLRERTPPPTAAPEFAAARGPSAATLSYEQNLQSVKDIAKQDPSIVANVVKDWVGKGD
jgi:flagellar M-ring protein FliF